MNPPSDAHRLASQLRVPCFPRDTPPRERVSALEEFMLVSAFHAGELHAERLGLYEQLEPLKREWDDLQGWEAHARGKTDEARNSAKRIIRPDLHEPIADFAWSIRRLTEELDRLERDAAKVSRAYTMIAGP